MLLLDLLEGSLRPTLDDRVSPPAFMNDTPFKTWTRFRVRAVLVGKRVDLKALHWSDRLTDAPLTVPAGENGLAVLFRYGAVVLFNLPVAKESVFLAGLKSVVGEPHDTPETEEAEICLDADDEERVDATGVIRLQQVTMERLLVIADVLAKSVILSYDEHRVARAFDRIEPVAEGLRRPGRAKVSARQLLDHIGDVLITQHRMVGRVEVTEKPDLLWDRRELERFYLRLQEEYELPERDRALSRKLDLIAQTASTSLGLLEAKQSLRVEWYITILIVAEIFLSLYDIFVVRGH